jgi:hypothetical protein
VITLVVWCALQAPLGIPLGWRIVAVRGERVKLERRVSSAYVDDLSARSMPQCLDRRIKMRRGKG